jgi:hypothetical protein
MRSCSTILLLLLIPFLAGCPSSNHYRPLPNWESKFYSQSRRDVFPDDVRRSPQQYAHTLVAWTGILRNIERGTDDNGGVAYLAIEHHYFDWIEDHSVQREIYFLSQRGEGTFRVAWGIRNPDDEKFISQFHVGDMIVAYGYPAEVRNRVVGLYPTMNLRAIDPRWFRTDVMEYGRPGEPAKLNKVAF